jgi:5-methylcytosine-specific restriction endonuclease McrA
MPESHSKSLAELRKAAGRARAEAAAAGRTRYFTGQPCKRGHIAERFVATGTCVQCAAEHEEAYKPRRAVVHAARIETIRKEKAAWKKRNRDRDASNRAARRARELQAMPQWLTAEHRAEIAALYREAARLSRETGIRHHVDHIYPLAGKLCSGLHVPWNLQILTAVANMAKSNALPDDTGLPARQARQPDLFNDRSGNMVCA